MESADHKRIVLIIIKRIVLMSSLLDEINYYFWPNHMLNVVDSENKYGFIDETLK